MAYVMLGIAIITEIVASSFLRETNGFTRLVPSLLCGAAYLVCHLSFSKAVLQLNLGVAYAIWCGVGIVVTSAVSLLIYKEKLGAMSYLGLLFILVGIVLVNVSAN